MAIDTGEPTNKLLFKHSMKGEWEEVVEMYNNDKKAHEARITRSRDTALHIAVTDGQDEFVRQLVGGICRLDQDQQYRKKVLGIQNERGNTALHLAASTGNVQMCQFIAQKEASLLSVPNVDGETPLFLAALHGRKEAFLSLHYICHKDNTDPKAPNYYSNCIRKDGDTILHSAIAGDYFDLAFQIIHLYEDLVNSVNKSGFSPLHLLANKPSVFWSGSRPGRFETIVYHCLIVKKLKKACICLQQCPTQDKDINSYPENYQTCMEFLNVIKKSPLPVTNPLTQFLNCKLRKHQTSTKEDLEASEEATNGAKTKSSGSETRDRSHPLFPSNYRSCADFFKFVFLVLLVILGKGLANIKKIQRKKEKHVWCAQIMDELLERASMYEYGGDGSKPQQNLQDEAEETVDEGNTKEQQPSTSITKVKQQKNGNEKDKKMSETPILIEAMNDVTEKVERILESFPVAAHDLDAKKKKLLSTIILTYTHRDKKDKKMPETPILIAAKNGVTEMVGRILELFPVAAHDMDANKKNIVLLAVENRQTYLYEFLLEQKNLKTLKESIFRKVDNEGNSAVHLAAKLGDYKRWLIPGEALQMHWEIKWYLFVKDSMPPNFFHRYNNQNKTPRDIFSETHKDLVNIGGEWLKKTSESCSVVAALIATVAFSTSTSVPGGVNDDTGAPTLEGRSEFKAFAISSLIALCCSVTSVVVFLSMLTSRHQEQDFGRSLPRKLIIGLTSLFMSITSIMVSFCAGHFFVLRDKLRSAAYPVYAVTCLPVTLFALAQFPLYIDLIWATFKKVPQRGYKTALA